MKKLFLGAVVAMVALCSCNKTSAPSASLKTDIDTLSYELGMLNANGLKNYLVQRLGVDTTYMDEFYKGLMEAAQAGKNAKKTAYFAGLQIGQQVGTQMYEGINEQLFAGDSTQHISMRNFLAAFIAATEGKAIFNIDSVQKGIQGKVEACHAKYCLQQYAANKEAGEKFLAQKKGEEGVKELANGVLYKVIKEGNGPIPTTADKCLVCYEGKLVDGKVFDSTYDRLKGEPTEIEVEHMIPGWIEALTHMPQGSVWELYIPYDQAYGADERGNDIKPFSALIFKLELKEVKKQ